MSLKNNWPAVYADVEQLFNDPPDDIAFETHETVELTADGSKPAGTRSATRSTGSPPTGITQPNPCSRTWP